MQGRFYLELVRMLGFLPFRISYYRLAFLPKSAVHPPPPGHPVNNERLEYLGDAVLDAIVADYLFTRFPGKDEGFMSQLRARIVKRKSMDHLAWKMGIPALVRPVITPGNQSKHLYGNVLEALIGAIYLDRGYRKTRQFFVRKIIRKHIDLEQLVKKDSDYKSRIIEWAQKNRIEVTFQSQEEHPPASRFPSFVSTLVMQGEEKGTGRGASKKEAEQQAARKALATIRAV